MLELGLPLNPKRESPNMKLLLGAILAISLVEAGCAHLPCVAPERALAEDMEGRAQTVNGCWPDQDEQFQRVTRCLVTHRHPMREEIVTIRQSNIGICQK